jgi:hypothetical protein
MSSTARGGKRSPADFYATPAWPVHRLLEALPLPGGLWLEPSAGEGAIIEAVNNVRHDVRWHAYELREACRMALTPLVRNTKSVINDFNEVHDLDPPGTFEVSISNYPFSQAMGFIEKSLASGIPYVISLLRLNFVGTEERNGFFRGNMPDIYVIPDRVSFAKSISCFSKTCDYATIVSLTARVPKKCPQCGSKLRVSSTDSIEYAWFVWDQKHRSSRKGSIEVLAHTPLEERGGLCKSEE